MSNCQNVSAYYIRPRKEEEEEKEEEVEETFV